MSHRWTKTTGSSRAAIAILLTIAAGRTARALELDDLPIPARDRILWYLPAEQPFEQQGIQVADAGDVDGDGLDDFIVGLLTVPTGADGNHTSARVYSGASGKRLREVPAPGDLRQPTENSVAGLGDLNGDGRAEFAVGTPGVSPTPSGEDGVVRIFDSSGTLLGSIPGPQPDANFSLAIASAGDVNDDGIPDLIIGAPDIERAYIHDGNPASGFALLVTLAGTQSGERFGAAVAGLGRVAPPGSPAYSAVVVGAPQHGPATVKDRPGGVYVFDVALPAAAVHIVTGDVPGDQLGASVDGGMDVDGDGVPDFLAGALGTPILGPPRLGYVRLFSGSSASVLRSVSSTQAGDLFGYSASFGERCADAVRATVVVGAPQAVDPETGVMTGRVDVLDAGDGSAIATIHGAGPFDALGTSVAGSSRFQSTNAMLLAGAPGADVPPQAYGGGAAFVWTCTPPLRPDIAVSPRPLLFDPVQAQGQRALPVEVRNEGTARLDVASATVAAGSSPAFGLPAPPGAFVLLPDESRNIEVGFAPQTPGIHSGTLRIASDDPRDPVVEVPLAGLAVLPRIEVTPLDIDFGNVGVGGAEWKAIRIRNVGNGDLAVLAIERQGSTSFAVAGAPDLPAILSPLEDLIVTAIYAPVDVGSDSGAVSVSSTDPLEPEVQVSLDGSSVRPNLPPIPAILMDVPYQLQANRIQLRGDDSADPDGAIAGHFWEFGHDGQTSGATNPLHTFPIPGAGGGLGYFVTRLTVTDDRGKSDTTSVTVVTSSRPIRSRFHGRVLHGGSYVRTGTVIEAWVRGAKVAETVTMTHLGRSVYAIDVPPQLSSDPQTVDGGRDGDEVTFRFGGETAEDRGVWYRATDQELLLRVPLHLPDVTAPEPPDPDGWCLLLPGGILFCLDGEDIPPGGIDFDVKAPLPDPPPPPPGSLRFVVDPFQVSMSSSRTGEDLGGKVPYRLHVGYSPAGLAALEIADAGSLAVHQLVGGGWIPAGDSTVDPSRRRVTSSPRSTGTFALLGPGGEDGGGRFIRGDTNGDGLLDITDAIRTLSYLFGDGPSLPCEDAADAGGEGRLTISSPIYLLGFLFLGGPAPPAPFPGCGLDPTPDALDCATPPDVCP